MGRGYRERAAGRKGEVCKSAAYEFVAISVGMNAIRQEVPPGISGPKEIATIQIVDIEITASA